MHIQVLYGRLGVGVAVSVRCGPLSGWKGMGLSQKVESSCGPKPLWLCVACGFYIFQGLHTH
jgi:hypothetical protein